MKKDVVIIHYNTPRLTEAAIRSLDKTTKGCHVIVFDNSDREPFFTEAELRAAEKGDAADAAGTVAKKARITGTGTERKRNGDGNGNGRRLVIGETTVEVIDNTKGQLIDWTSWLDGFKDKEPSPGNDYGSAKHCRSVQWIVDHRKNPFVLMDSDVLLKDDVSFLWDREQAFVGHIGCNTRRFGYVVNRVEPWLCYINVRMMRANGISYFNGRKMWNLVSVAPDDHYDTGAWFLEECERIGLPYKDMEMKDYGLHLRHGSWGKKKQEAWLEENKKLWK